MNIHNIVFCGISVGESPSSSASDIDNLNIQVMMERATLSKGGATHIAGNHVLVAENRPNFVRLLDFVSWFEGVDTLSPISTCLGTFYLDALA